MVYAVKSISTEREKGSDGGRERKSDRDGKRER